MALLGDLLVKIGVDAGGVEESLGKVDGFFERHAGKIAAAGAAIGGAGAAAIGQGLQTGLEKEALGDKLAAQLGATGPEAARFGKIAGNLYSEAFGRDLGQVSDAVDAVVSSIDGMRTASNSAVQDMTGKVLNLAQAFEIDVGRSAQVVGQIVKSGLVKDATQGMDLLTAAFQRVPAAVREDLLDALDEYSPFMQQIGIKGQDAFNLLVQAAEKGAFGLDKTGDALKEFLIRATDMSTGTKSAYDAIGLSQKKMTADLLAGGDRGAQAFSKIITGLRNIKDPTKQSQAALALFGTQLEDVGLENIPGFLAQLDTTKNTLGDTAGAADKLGQTLSDNAATGIESWKRKTEGALASMANAPGVFGDTAQAVTGIGTAIAPIGSDLGGLAAAAFVGAKALGPIGSGAMKAAMFVGQGTVSIIASGARMAGSMALAAARVVAGWVLIGAQALLAAARVALSWLIAFAPVVIVIAILALVVAMVIKYWDQIKRAVGAAVSWVIGFVKSHWPLLLGIIGGPIGLVVGMIIKHWSRIKSTFSSGVSAVVGFVRRLPGRIRSAIGNLGSLLVGAGRNIINGLIRGITSRISGLLSTMSNLAGKIRGFLPFSPAKEGPLSGRGNPQLAGAKIGDMVAAGMRQSTGRVAAAAGSLAAAASVNGSGGVSTSGAAARAGVPSGVRAVDGSANRVVLDLRGGDREFRKLIRKWVSDAGGDVQVVMGPA